MKKCSGGAVLFVDTRFIGLVAADLSRYNKFSCCVLHQNCEVPLFKESLKNIPTPALLL
jgi:hypothetical protein